MHQREEILEENLEEDLNGKWNLLENFTLQEIQEEIEFYRGKNSKPDKKRFALAQMQYYKKIIQISTDKSMPFKDLENFNLAKKEYENLFLYTIRGIKITDSISEHD
jgi:hypothetical protein